MPMAKERPMKSSLERVLYLDVSVNSHDVGAFMVKTEDRLLARAPPRKWLRSRSVALPAGVGSQQQKPLQVLNCSWRSKQARPVYVSSSWGWPGLC
jgi:hypothetical protein